MSDAPYDLEAIGKVLGNLVMVSIWQTRAVVDLANALKSDPGVTEATREKAVSALANVDKTIEKIEFILGEDGGAVMKAFFGEKK